MTNEPARGVERGHEIVGMRITVYHLLPSFLNPTETEASICREFGLKPEQVAAARAYVLRNPDTVLAEHLKIEARMAAGNPPEVIEQAKRTHAVFQEFKRWLAEREIEETRERLDEASSAGGGSRNPLPAFHKWLADQESGPVEGP
jgi:uncharacterized protein (DUF433 family)